MVTTQLRLGFAGAGDFAATVMAPVAHECRNVILQAVGCRDSARGEALEPVGTVHASYESLMNDPEVDAVYVVLANHLHASVAEMALRAGKHVLCEKPLSLNRQSVQQMHTVARENDRLLVEGFWYRWHPRQIELERIIAAGEIGQVRSVDSGFSFDREIDDNFRLDPAYGGGAFYDVGCYATSFAVAALGDREPVSATQNNSILTERGVDLRAQATLRWAGGEVATLTGGFAGPVGRWGTVVGTEGTVVLRDPAFSWHPEDPLGTRLEVFEPDGSLRGGMNFAPCHGRRLMMEAFADAVLGEIDPGTLPVTPAHSLAVSTSLDLVHESLGRTV